jgi:serine/threonine-protein kinase RsbW
LVKSDTLLKRTFPGRYASLASIREFVVEAAKDAGLAEDDVYRVELSVDEACTNIIEHAYGGEDKGEIKCSLIIEEDGLRIRLQDFGEPFDPSKVPEPRFNVPIDQLKSRGVGFFLMKKLMDELHYESTPHGGNVMVMYKSK